MSMPAGLSADQLTELSQFDTPTVCNAIELWSICPRNHGYMNASIRAMSPQLPPMVGYALTSTFRSMGAPRSSDAYGSIGQQLEMFPSLPGPPVVVFQDLDVPVAAATFGEVMCTTYQKFGAVGLITSGAGRDLAQVDAIQFPTFTSGAIAAHGYCHFPTIIVPVTVGGMVIHSADLLHGDLNGVTRIPHEIASEVAGVCREIARAEAVVLDYLRSKEVDTKNFDAARAECTQMIHALGKRLRGDK
jgi:regulator of RNase E activity RraA